MCRYDCYSAALNSVICGLLRYLACCCSIVVVFVVHWEWQLICINCASAVPKSFFYLGVDQCATGVVSYDHGKLAVWTKAAEIELISWYQYPIFLVFPMSSIFGSPFVPCICIETDVLSMFCQSVHYLSRPCAWSVLSSLYNSLVQY